MPKACRTCRLIMDKKLNVCPNCKTQDLSYRFRGQVWIIDPENSEIAKALKFDKPGHYALIVD